MLPRSDDLTDGGGGGASGATLPGGVAPPHLSLGLTGMRKLNLSFILPIYM